MYILQDPFFQDILSTHSWLTSCILTLWHETLLSSIFRNPQYSGLWTNKSSESIAPDLILPTDLPHRMTGMKIHHSVSKYTGTSKCNSWEREIEQRQTRKTRQGSIIIVHLLGSKVLDFYILTHIIFIYTIIWMCSFNLEVYFSCFFTKKLLLCWHFLFIHVKEICCFENTNTTVSFLAAH